MPIYPNGYNPAPAQTYSQQMNQTIPNYPYIQPQQQTSNSFAWVTGKVGAEAYPVAPGNTVMLMDENDMKLYIKSVDLNGRPSPLKTYTLVEEDSTQDDRSSIDTSSFVTRDELDSILDEKIQKLNRHKNNKKKGEMNNG